VETQQDRPGFIQREVDRIAVALRNDCDPKRYERLYAAQQALSWALEPTGFRSPYDWAMDIPVMPADCSAYPRPLQSSDTCSPNWLTRTMTHTVCLVRMSATK
jgi:hypothetical protein